MRILFLSRWFPFPADNGSKIRIYNLLKSLSSEHEVALLSFAEDPSSSAAIQALQTLCARVETVVYRGFQAHSVRARLGFLSPMPRSLIDTFSAEMAEKARRMACEWKPDCIIASQIDMIPYAALLKDTPKVAEEIELTIPYEAYARASDPIVRMRRGLTWWKLSAYLRRTLSTFHLCTVVSSQEQKLARKVVPPAVPVAVIPNGVDVQSLQSVRSDPQPDVLIYSGALSYSANFDAMYFFLSEMFPQIVARAPRTKLLITGSTKNVPLERLPNRENVVFTGYVEDIRAVIGASWVSIAPLRLGGGTRLKVIESLALGVPVVATSKGVEGLELKRNEEVLVADTPQEFVEATLALLTNPDLRARLSLAGRRAASRYDWSLTGRYLNRLLAEMVSSSSPEPVPFVLGRQA